MTAISLMRKTNLLIMGVDVPENFVAADNNIVWKPYCKNNPDCLLGYTQRKFFLQNEVSHIDAPASSSTRKDPSGKQHAKKCMASPMQISFNI